MSRNGYNPDVDAPTWRGGHQPYDIIKEGTIALVLIALLTIILASVFGSPDDKYVTIKQWSNADPVDFATTALSELNGTSGTAQYGAPYNSNGSGQTIGPLALQRWMGVHIPVNTVKDFVLDPLSDMPDQPALTTALSQWKGANSSTQNAWVSDYTNASSKMTYANNQVEVPAHNAGPVPIMINDLTQMARTGALDQALVTANGFYTTNYTKPLLFLADGNYFANLGDQRHLSGDQWGMMNETGNYPGQAWLWLYTMWYQVPPFSTSDNADALVWGLMMLLSVILLLVPFIPGLRTIPRKTKIYRLIWREHYQQH